MSDCKCSTATRLFLGKGKHKSVDPLEELVDSLERVILFLKGQQIRCFALSEGGSRALYR